MMMFVMIVGTVQMFDVSLDDEKRHNTEQHDQRKILNIGLKKKKKTADSIGERKRVLNDSDENGIMKMPTNDSSEIITAEPSALAHTIPMSGRRCMRLRTTNN